VHDGSLDGGDSCPKSAISVESCRSEHYGISNLQSSTVQIDVFLRGVRFRGVHDVPKSTAVDVVAGKRPWRQAPSR